jgi:hypothetical protein
VKPAAPSALGQAGIAAAIGLASAFLMPFACGVDTRPPAPPQLSTGQGGSGPSGAGGAGGSSAASTSAGPGPATVCACAAAAFTPGSLCADCFHEVSGVDCAEPVTTFQKSPGSAALLVALAACDAGAQCIADTLATDPARNAYLDVLACVCVPCGSACAAPSEVGCDAGKIPVEAGSDAEGDAAIEDASADAPIDAVSDAIEDAEDAGG